MTNAPERIVLQPCPTYGWQHPDRVKYPTDTAKEYRLVRPRTVAEDDVNKLAEVLMAEWKRVDPNSNVAQHMTSYVATFADMARAAIAATKETT